MNLVGTLGKILLSGALKKGGAGGLGSLLGGATGGGAGGLGDLLGGLAGGKGGAAGGLGDLLGQLQKQGGAAQAGGAGAGAGGLLGGLLGGGDQAAGGLGGLLGSALGQQGQAAPPAPTPEQTDHAALLIRSMINAAKCDGAVDQSEQEKIVGKLGDIDAEEAAFIRNEMQAPLDVDAFVRSVPRGMEQQVYAVSVMSIDLDSKVEAEYLDKLAKGLNISEQVSNQMHTEMGVPVLYG